MVLVNSTSGLKSSQAEWFASDITVPFANTKFLEIRFQITSDATIAYTRNSGTNWTDFDNGSKANTTTYFIIPITSGDQFNIRKSTAGDVTVTSCELSIRPKSKDRLTFSENRTTNSALYYAYDGNQALGSNNTESTRRLPITDDFVITRMRANASTNGKDGNTVISFRDDAADATSLTYNAAETGEKDSGALKVFVVGGSECAFKSDTSASTNGNSWSLGIATVEIEYLPDKSLWYDGAD